MTKQPDCRKSRRTSLPQERRTPGRKPSSSDRLNISHWPPARGRSRTSSVGLPRPHPEGGPRSQKEADGVKDQIHRHRDLKQVDRKANLKISEPARGDGDRQTVPRMRRCRRGLECPVRNDEVQWISSPGYTPVTFGPGISKEILRKEVIQPQVPLRLPCYDLVPITGFIFGACLAAPATSDTPRFGGLTGGVYKAQEHIHRGMLIRDY